MYYSNVVILFFFSHGYIVIFSLTSNSEDIFDSLNNNAMHLTHHYYRCFYGQHSVILLKMRFLALNAKTVLAMCSKVSQFAELDGVTVTSGIQFNIPAIKVLI